MLQNYASNPDNDELTVISKNLEHHYQGYAEINEIFKFTKEVRHNYPEFNDSYNDAEKFMKNFNRIRTANITKFSELICFEYGYDDIRTY